MKPRKTLTGPIAIIKRSLILVGIAALCLFPSCEKDSKGTKFNETRTAYNTIIEANAVKQAAMYDIVKAFSGGYNQKILSKDLTKQEIDQVFAAIARAMAYEEKVEKAMLVINKESKNSLLYRHYPQLKSAQGIGDAMAGFFSWASGSGKRSRDRILTVASNLNNNDRSKLYNSLRPNWKSQASSESEFWNKLEKGEFDTQASQMYNDFYHNADTEFPDLAQDKGLSIQKIVVKEGAEGIKKGAEVLIETTKVVTPLGKGMDMVDKAKEYAEKAEKIYNDPAGTLKDEVKDKIANKLGGFVDIDGLVDAANLGEGFGQALKAALDAALGSDDPADWVKNALDWGAGKIVDSDKPGKKSDVVIAESKNVDPNQLPKVVIGITNNVKTEESSVDIVLPGGEWEITAVDLNGNIDKLITQITNGVMSIILANTNPADQVSDKSFSLSVYVSPADPGPFQSVTVYCQVYPKQAGVEVYYEVAGTDGYAKSGNLTTDAQGLCTFSIPGGAEKVSDVIKVTVVKTGLTRSLSYIF